MKKRIVFLTSSRADYGKLKPLLKVIEADNEFEPHLFVTGMHNLQRFGNTYRYIMEDQYENIERFHNSAESMDEVLANTIFGFSNYVKRLSPHMIVVHGDRIEALAAAVVGSFNNIKTVHIEGGEISGSIDESIRHAVTKLSHYHFVSNKDAKRRVIQLGEKEKYVFNIGSPDIDVMLSEDLPFIEKVMEKYSIKFTNYAIFLYHPVTTDRRETIQHKIQEVVQALIRSSQNYIVIYPNNDYGSDIIIKEYEKIYANPQFQCFDSIRFEDFLTLLKNSKFIIGNSSAGVREASVYGVPTVDIGQRQQGRYSSHYGSIRHVLECQDQIVKSIHLVSKMDRKCHHYFGDGQATLRFLSLLKSEFLWNRTYTKIFVDSQHPSPQREAAYV